MSDFQILLIRRFVSLRIQEASPIDGFLALFEDQETLSIQIAFIPLSKLDPETITHFNHLASKSRQALWKGEHLNNEPTVTLPECISTDLNLIHAIAFNNILTLQRGVSVCLSKLKIYLQVQQNNQHVLLCAIYFESNKYGKTPSIVEIQQEMEQWFKSIHKKLTPFPSLPNAFIFTDMTHDEIINIKSSSSVFGVPIDNRWEAPAQSNNIVKLATNFSNLSFNVVSSIVGKNVADSLANRVEDVGWNVLSTFSRVTEFSRDTTANVLEHPLSRPILPYIPQNLRSVFLSNGEVEELLKDYDSAGHYLANWGKEMLNRSPMSAFQFSSKPTDTTRDYETLKDAYMPVKSMPPIGLTEFNTLLSAKNIKLIRARIFSHGVSPQARQQIWKFLFLDQGYNDVDSAAQYESMKVHWETILADMIASGSAPHSPDKPNPSAPGDEREAGDYVSKIRERKFRIEKDVVRTDRNVSFFAGLETDVVHPPIDENGAFSPPTILSPNLSMLRDILITYTLYDFELGYVQGMNDLLSPILFVVRSESDAFWCFVTLMNRTSHNFKRDQSGMRTKLRHLELLIKFMDPFLYTHLQATDSLNLFCCFRWLLVLFKREFSFDEILRLWESIWACPLTNHYDIFIAFAILNKYRKEIINKTRAFDETLRFINDLSGNCDVLDILKRSHILFRIFQDEFSVFSKSKLEIILEKTHLPCFIDDENEDEFILVGESHEQTEDSFSGAIQENSLLAESNLSTEELWDLLTILEHNP